MIVYDYFRSSASYRLRIALNLKGLKPERRFVHLAKGEQRAADYKALNPQGFVPLLIDDDFSLGQSMAMIEYLDEKYPTPPLMPADIESRAVARQIAQLIACDIHPLNNSRVLAYLSNDLKLSDATKAQWICKWIHDGFAALEAMLAKRTTQSKFCIGDTPTIADICLIPQVTNATRFSCSMDAFPAINAIYQHAMTLPAFHDAQPRLQPDAE
jgi:maleylacetoacetate isomerase